MSNFKGWNKVEGEVLTTKGSTIWLNVDGVETPINSTSGTAKHVMPGHKLTVLRDKRENVARVSRVNYLVRFDDN
jgi:hypothetical protein